MWPVMWSIVRPYNYKRLSCKHAHDFTGAGQDYGEGHHFMLCSTHAEPSLHPPLLPCRFCVHYPNQDRSRLPPAECRNRVCGLCPWPQGAHHLCKYYRVWKPVGTMGDRDCGPGPQETCCLQRIFFQILPHSTCIRDLAVRMNLRGADIGHHISDLGVGKCFGK